MHGKRENKKVSQKTLLLMNGRFWSRLSAK